MTDPTSNPNDHPRINLNKTEQPAHPGGPQPDPYPQSYQGPAVGQPPAPVPYAAPYPGQYPYPAEYRAADAHTIAMLAHLSLLLWGFTPLILWAVYKDKPGYGFTKRACARAFNFTMTVMIAELSVIAFSLLGFLVLMGITAGSRDAAAVAAVVFMIGLIVVLGIVTVMLILAIIFPIMGAIRANRGEEYRYPLPHIKILDEDG